MKKRRQEKQINKQFKTIRGHLKSFLRTADQDELHQFRVGVKKLKALFVFMQKGAHQRRLLKQFKPVRKVFKKAGNIRNAHINLSLSNQYQFADADFTKQQHRLLTSATLVFLAKGKKYLKKIKQTEKKVASHQHQLSKKRVVKFYRDNLAHIEMHLQKPDDSQNLHVCRKKIKLLLYNQKPANEALNHPLQLNAPYLDQLQESIGTWHDNALAMELFDQMGMQNKLVLSKLKRRNGILQKRIGVLSAGFMAKATGTDAALSPQ